MRLNIQDKGDDDYAASTTGFVEGIRSEPALSPARFHGHKNTRKPWINFNDSKADSGSLRGTEARIEAVGRNPAPSGMRAHGVVEGLQIGKNVCVRSCARGILLQVDEFAFQTAEEVLGNGVVVGIAPVGHTLPDAIGFQSLPVGSGCVLNAAVTVEDQVRRRFPPAVCHLQSRQRQMGIRERS